MILLEDKDLILCHKSAGIPVQSASVTTMDMESMLLTYLSQNNKGNAVPYVGIIHRLDQPVEGLVVFAKNPKAAAVLNRQIKEGTIDKYYLALVENTTSDKAEEDWISLTDYLVKDNRTNTSQVADKQTRGAKKALLSYRCLASGDKGSLMEIRLDTGRHHQIRVQMAHAGMPLSGDRKYNPDRENIKAGAPLCLCAYRLAFDHPTSGKRIIREIKPAWAL